VKYRADQLLVSRGLAETRSRAQALIMAGAVFSAERKLGKAGDMLAEDAPLEVRGKDHPWVSRGGIKLDHGLTHFGFDVAGAVALDVGSSTGGFTDVLLSRGATKVYAVDVGTNQLAWKLRQDARVVVHEQTNARHLSAETVPELVDIIVCDASFISLSKVLEAPLRLGKAGAKLVALVKPQFEAGRAEVGKGGVVRDPGVHQRVCSEAAEWIVSQGWRILGITESPITGPEGNIEFLLGAVQGLAGEAAQSYVRSEVGV
jgi:23S rRNA (cytidine1920-2'-O)/16S rRNA (cytidine1409-2'-O)-methyltransferase